jgi:hypothetical protein
MKVVLRVARDATGGTLGVYVGDGLSHHIRESELGPVLEEARFNA